MKLETTTMIGDDRVYNTEKKMGHLDIYESSENNDDVKLYFVNRKSSDVEFVMKITADCCQNVGYVSDWNLQKY